MSTEIEVKATLPILSTNFELIKSELSAELEKYKNVVVTLDTLASDKKLANEVAAKGKAFDTIRKEKVAEISAPITLFTTQMNSLKGMCIELANSIKDQVKVFESEKLKEIQALLKKTMIESLDAASVDDEFRILSIDHLVKLTAITKKGALTKASKDEINAIVSDKRAIMQTTQLRLAQLETESFRAGLDVPLVRLNVENFLFSTDEEYQENLTKVIESECQRQVTAAARKKELADKAVALAAEQEKKNTEQQQQRSVEVQHTENESKANHFAQSRAKESAERVNPLRSQSAASQQQVNNSTDETTISDGKVTYVATAQFKLRVPPHITSEQIQSKLERMLLDAGINSLHSIGVMRDA